MISNIKQSNYSEIIKKLFPPEVEGIILPIDDYTSELTPDEYKIIENASEKRKREFSTGRKCAKQAMKKLGIEEVPILKGENREPLWPEGVVGSISHCKDLCGAVIGASTDIKAIGLDLENIKKLKNDISRLICTDYERKWIAQQKNHSYETLILLIFSLKESIYKCIYASDDMKIGFKDCTVIPNLRTKNVKVHFEAEIGKTNIQQNFNLGTNRIYTCAWHA